MSELFPLAVCPVLLKHVSVEIFFFFFFIKTISEAVMFLNSRYNLMIVY